MRRTLPLPLPPLVAAARAVVVPAAIVALSLTVGACSSARERTYQSAAWAGAQPPVPAPQTREQQVYEAAPGDPIKDAPVEPRQGAPGQLPDDPREPYSPNYGGPRDRPLVRVGEAPDAVDPEPDRRQPRAPRMTATAAAD